MAKKSRVASRIGAQIGLIKDLHRLFGRQLRKMHPTAYNILARTVQDNPDLLPLIEDLKLHERDLLLGLTLGVVMEALPELKTQGMAQRGKGHPFLRRNDNFLCLVPDYRPPRGIGVGIGIRQPDGNWNLEFGEVLSQRQLEQAYPKTQFFTWDQVIDRLWRER